MAKKRMERKNVQSAKQSERKKSNVAVEIYVIYDESDRVIVHGLLAVDLVPAIRMISPRTVGLLCVFLFGQELGEPDLTNNNYYCIMTERAEWQRCNIYLIQHRSVAMTSAMAIIY